MPKPPPTRIRPALALVLLLVAATPAAGCGSSSEETGAGGTGGASGPGQEAPVGVRAETCAASAALGGEVRVTGVSCAVGRMLVAGWQENDACSSPPGLSRASCRLGGFICLGAVTDRGLAVTCAGPNRSVAFLAKPR